LIFAIGNRQPNVPERKPKSLTALCDRAPEFHPRALIARTTRPTNARTFGLRASVAGLVILGGSGGLQND